MTDFKVGDKATITQSWHDGRVWGDTVTITMIGRVGDQVAYDTDHEVYGGWGNIMFEDELEPFQDNDDE